MMDGIKIFWLTTDQISRIEQPYPLILRCFVNSFSFIAYELIFRNKSIIFILHCGVMFKIYLTVSVV
jgi:hypothetical protein